MAYWPRVVLFVLLSGAQAAEPLRDTDWSATWIRAAAPAETTPALPLLRREFRLEKRVARAILYVSGLGQYELHLNGLKVGNGELTPGWTDYRQTVLYNTFDITSGLRKGVNVFGVLLGNGHYNVPQTKERYTGSVRSFGEPKLLLQAQIQFADGTRTRILSDHTWRTAQGPIVFSSPFGGEDYDARLELPGWELPGFREKNWLEAQETEGPGGKLIEQKNLIRVNRTLKAVKITELAAGIRVYDFGEVLDGWPEISVSGPRGAVVKLVGGELLDRDGFASQRLSNGPQWFSYTLKGAGTERWRPRFSDRRFRYLQVELQADLGVFPEIISLDAQSLTEGLRQLGNDDPGIGQAPLRQSSGATPASAVPR